MSSKKLEGSSYPSFDACGGRRASQSYCASSKNPSNCLDTTDIILIVACFDAVRKYLPTSSGVLRNQTDNTC